MTFTEPVSNYFTSLSTLSRIFIMQNVTLYTEFNVNWRVTNNLTRTLASRSKARVPKRLNLNK